MADDRPFHIVLGLLANKDAEGVLKPFSHRATTVHGVPVPGHAHHSPETLAQVARALGLTASPAKDVESALDAIADSADRRIRRSC